eukprot:TRINITY_DN3651_c0_g1_i4.p1 TRINITY_DN3651_c0_g1~~TRINITY_DN3651_c0_g1_i4.p1  ORF type:complete len:113 (-),score=0.05 TRINITY_DN3651_c0_g1_i4:10-348(-)
MYLLEFLVPQCFYIEPYCRERLNCFTQLQIVQYCCLSCCVQTQHHYPTLFICEAEKLCDFCVVDAHSILEDFLFQIHKLLFFFFFFFFDTLLFVGCVPFDLNLLFGNLDQAN